MEQATRLLAILDSAVDAIITIDAEGIVETVNPATQKMFGYEATELVGNNISRLMPEPFCREHDGYLRAYLQSGQTQVIGLGREVIGRRKDGTTFPIHLAVSEFQDAGRRLFTGIVRDISQLKAAEQQLRDLNESLEERVRLRTAELEAAQIQLVKKEKLATLGQVAGGIAHEIRNPLNAVKTSVYFLTHAKDPTAEKTLEHLDRIDRQVTMIDNVVSALSDVAKMPDPVLKPYQVSELLELAQSGVSLPNSLRVVVEVEAGLPAVMVDANQMPIVLRNLIRNARDAMPDGGTLILRGQRRGSEVVLSVIDEGQGIAPDVLHKVMQPFFSTKARGMGLGLAISKTIAELNRGRIHVASALGSGSRFDVILQASPES